MTLTDLLSDSAMNESDKQRKNQLLRAQCNVIESFFAFAQETCLGIKQTSDTNPTYFALTLREKIKSNYVDTPTHDGR